MVSSIYISIVLPVYNVAEHIERCIISLIDQEFTNFEMLFVDDGGQDESVDIIKKYAAEDSRIRIAKNDKNLGTYHARKVGAENALGTYVLFLDPDDELEKDFVSYVVSKIKFNSVDIIFYNAKFVPKRKFYQTKPILLPFSQTDRIIESVFSRAGRNSVSSGTVGKIFKRTFLLSIYSMLDVDINYRYVFTEDRLIYFAALLKNPSYLSLDYKGYVYHKNSSSITNKTSFNDPSLLIDQQLYTITRLKELISENVENLTKKEVKILHVLVIKTEIEEISLMRRYENNGKHYLFHVYNAFRAIPSIKQLARACVYLATCKKIKL